MKPTLLFLHCFGGSGSTWTESVAALADRCFPCLTPDLRGFGDSRTVGEFSFAANVRDVLAICDSLAGEKVILVGHSMGGKIALAVASQRPDAVVGVVLIAPSPPTPDPMPDEERIRLLVGLGDRHAAEETFANLTVAPLPSLLRERFLRDSVRVKPAAWREWLEDGTRQDISANLGPVLVPTLILIGAQDETITLELVVREVVSYCPNAAVKMVPDAAHLIPLEQPERLADKIVEWWADTDAGPKRLPAYGDGTPEGRIAESPSGATADVFLAVIKTLKDPKLSDVFRIWETSFPPEEKNPAIFWLQHFARLYHPELEDSLRRFELIAICGRTPTGDDAVLGMALSEVVESRAGQKVGFVRFLAIDPDRRGGRVGSRAFDALRDRLLIEHDCTLMVWEVEPAEQSTEANRRYYWYRRMGGRRLLGVDHSIQIPGQPNVPLWVFVISRIETDYTQIYEGVCAALESEVAITATVTLEPT